MPVALCLKDEVAHFTDGAMATIKLGYVMRGLFCFRDCISNRNRQFDAIHDRNIADVVTNVSAFVY